MNLTTHLGSAQILTGVVVQDKWELINRMVDALEKHRICQKQNEDVRVAIRPTIIAREKEMTTALGGGYAFPHGRVPGFSSFAAAVAFLEKPVDFEAPDGIPVKVVCMAVTSQENPTMGLRVMTTLTGLLSDKAVYNFFLHEKNPQEIFKYLEARKVELDIPITAREIMRPDDISIVPDLSLPNVTRLMQKHGLEAVAVTDADHKIVGQITCDLLFCKGIPDFFTQLQSVSFIKEFDPFEKYFADEAGAVAGDVMSTDYAAVNEDATLLEIIHLLSVRGYPKIYVLRDGRHVGTIDRITVLDRILNL